MNAVVDAPISTVEGAPAWTADQAIGQIAVNLPGATAVFRRLKLDFCCGGQTSLRQAVQEKNLELPSVATELNALSRSDALPQVPTPAALIDHIIARYHDVHREQLPELIRMARRVEAVHRDNPNVPAGLGDLLERAEAELLEHMQKEETILFPALKSGATAMAAYPMVVMRDEHTRHGEMLEELMALTHDAVPPPGACNTWRALYAGIGQLGDDLINHIHLENNVLFPQFESSAPAAVASGCGSGGGCSCAG